MSSFYKCCTPHACDLIRILVLQVRKRSSSPSPSAASSVSSSPSSHSLPEERRGLAPAPPKFGKQHFYSILYRDKTKEFLSAFQSASLTRFTSGNGQCFFFSNPDAQNCRVQILFCRLF